MLKETIQQLYAEVVLYKIEKHCQEGVAITGIFYTLMHVWVDVMM